MSVKHTGRGK